MAVLVGACIKFMSEVETDVHLRALALTNSGSSKKEQSPDHSGLSRCVTIE